MCRLAVLRVDGTTIPEAAVNLATEAGALLLDAKVVGQLGGTGTQLDWAGLANAVMKLRAGVNTLQLVLAGGLNAQNVGTAHELLRPDVVDVSSGVEVSPGVKDADAMAAFISAARASVVPAPQATRQR